MSRSTYSVSGTPGDITRVTATDTATNLADAIVISGTRIATSVLIYCEDNDVRYTFGDTDPTQGAGATGHLLAAGATMELTGAAVRGFKYINAVNGSNAVLQVTAFFAGG